MAQEEPQRGQYAMEQDWHRAARSAGLSPKAIQHLEKEKVLLTADDFFQCFQAYLPIDERDSISDKTELPYFITTDALFQAYSWCMQKSVANMEQMHAEQTREYLEVLMKSLNRVEDLITGNTEAIRAAKERAMFVIGVAATLMDLKTNISESLKQDVEYEVTRIRLALGSGKPKRLILPSPTFSDLDYTIFKPSSFYAADPILAGYFRAVRWLQLIPFRLSSDEDMLAVAMINLSQEQERLKKLNLNPKVAEYWEAREQRLAELAGPTAHLLAIGGFYQDPFGKEASKPIPEWIKEARDWFGLLLTPNDDHWNKKAITSTLQAAAKDEVCAYMASASSLADAVLIEKHSRSEGQMYFPNALSVASWLGSGYAAEVENADNKALVIRSEAQKLIDGSDKYSDLHAESLRVLQRLFEPVPPDAPAFMKSRAWQAKSCQTALAGWAQVRHVWALQAKAQYSVGAGVQGWPAFIEPIPDFFSGLAGLCHQAELHFQRARQGYDQRRQVAGKLRKMADEHENPSDKNASIHEQRLTTLEILLEAGLPHLDGDYNDPKLVRQVSEILRENADHIEKGEADSGHPVAQKLKAQLSALGVAPFKKLEETCLRLASLAHKQMRGLSPREEEHQWLRYFGVVLAEFTDCHFTAARDTVPKAVRVFTNVTLDKALTVGIGRPTFLYVLYPWKGKDILCRGAVLPYLERHEMQTYTDDEWRINLHHPEKPAVQPGWLRPLLSD